MKKIIVTELLKSPILLSEEKGKDLLAELKRNFIEGEQIEVDFKNYQFLSSAFLNSSFGQFCVNESLTLDHFNKIVKIINLDDNGKDDLDLCLSNAQLRKKYIEEGHNEEDFYSTIAYS